VLTTNGNEQKILTTENTENTEKEKISAYPQESVYHGKYNKDRQRRVKIINPVITVNPVKEEENIYHFVSCGKKETILLTYFLINCL